MVIIWSDLFYHTFPAIICVLPVVSCVSPIVVKFIIPCEILLSNINIQYITYVVWIDRTLEGKRDGTAAGLLEECVLDDDEGKCERFTNALTKLDNLLGVGAAEQY